MKIFLIDILLPPAFWMLIFFSLLLFLIYYSILLYMLRIWKAGCYSSDLPESNFDFHVSVVIAGRNEASNIKACLDSVFANDFPSYSYEVIYVDDYSNDDSIEVLRSVIADNFSFFQLKEYPEHISGLSYKKSAVKLGVRMAKGSLILLTDADTVVGRNWIKSHVLQYAYGEVQLCTGPVVFFSSPGLLNQFQKYDLMATMGITYGGIASGSYHLANGANMSFLKNAYDHTASRPEFASGDDIFLVNHIASISKNSIKFIQSEKAVVKTYPEPDLMAFFRQRIRWGTKSKAYTNSKLKAILVVVFLINLLIITDIIVFASLRPDLLIFILMLLFFKLFIDVLFIHSIADRLAERINYSYLIISLLFYPLYIIPAGLLSIFVKNYNWKGRRVK